MGIQAGPAPRRRIPWQGLAAALLLARVLLGAWWLLHRGVVSCATVPNGDLGLCLLAEIPAADLSPATMVVAPANPTYASLNPPQPEPPRTATRTHVSATPDWWVHGFYRLVLQLQGWQFLPQSSGTVGTSVQDTYCRPDACVYVKTSLVEPWYRVTADPKPRAP